MLLTNPFRPDPRVYDEAQALINKGYSVKILAWDRDSKYKKREENVDGIEVVRFGIPSSYGEMKSFVKGLTKFYFEVLKYCRNEKFEIVHANDFDTLPLAIMLKKLYRARVVYDSHDYYSSMIAESTPPFVSKIVKKFERYLSKMADGRMAATEALGKEVFGNLDFVTVMNAKDLNEYKVSEDEVNALREKYNLQGKFVIVYIGILKIWEPIPQIIEAVKNENDIFLLIGGDGPHREEILKMIEGAKNIKYMGWIEKKDIPKYVALTDIVVLPSDRRKDYTRVAVGNKILEGLVAGKPIIAGLGTEGGRIVKECNAGVLCDFGDVKCMRDSINYLRENRDAYEKFAKNARKCAEEKYNWSVMEKRLIALYHNVMR